jgi:hypothetical protein
VGNVLTIRFERFTVFKPPALPEVMTWFLALDLLFGFSVVNNKTIEGTEGELKFLITH